MCMACLMWTLYYLISSLLHSMREIKQFYHSLHAFKNFKDMDTNSCSVYLKKTSLKQSNSNDMCDYALMFFLFLLVYVLISNNCCKFLTNSKHWNQMT